MTLHPPYVRHPLTPYRSTPPLCNRRMHISNAYRRWPQGWEHHGRRARGWHPPASQPGLFNNADYCKLLAARRERAISTRTEMVARPSSNAQPHKSFDARRNRFVISAESVSVVRRGGCGVLRGIIVAIFPQYATN